MHANRLVILALALFLGSHIQAQDKTRYIFEGENVNYGGFGGPLFTIGGYDGQAAYYSGGGGGALINKRIILGGYGMGLTSDFNLPNPDGALPNVDYVLEFGHGGLWLGYNFSPEKAVHLTSTLLLGGGSISTEQYIGDQSNTLDRAGAFVATPMVGVELNLIRWMRLAAVGGYQYVASNGRQDAASKLSSPIVQLQLKFGFFGD